MVFCLFCAFSVVWQRRDRVSLFQLSLLRRTMEGIFSKKLKFVLWIFLGWLALKAEFGLVFIIVSALYAIFINLDHSSSPGKLSAYSVFNKDAYAIPGTMNASQFEQELRHQPAPSEAHDIRSHEGEPKDSSDQFKRASKKANELCGCGSGKKFKKW